MVKESLILKLEEDRYAEPDGKFQIGWNAATITHINLTRQEVEALVKELEGLPSVHASGLLYRPDVLALIRQRLGAAT